MNNKLILISLILIIVTVLTVNTTNYNHRHHQHHRHHHHHHHRRRSNIKPHGLEPLKNSNDWQTIEQQQQQQQRPKYIANITVKVGETVTLNCAINSSYGLNPGVIWMQGKLGNVLTLNTNRITVDGRFEISQQPISRQQVDETVIIASPPSPSQALSKMRRRNEEDKETNSNQHQSLYHLRINNVQIFDDNEYACETSISKQNEDESIVHSLIHLHVTQSPNFIESLTSDSTQVVVENDDLELKCYAIGKPVPKIRWFKIDDKTGEIKDLKEESFSLKLKNISKYDNSKYECVANNGILPSVSKQFELNVHYKPITIPTRPVVYQYIEQSVLLGCVVNSNPDSTITWYKEDPLKPLSFIKIINKMTNEQSSSNVQILKYKQTNKTISYYKIKNINIDDFARYKCEATNRHGKEESIIELLDMKTKIISQQQQQQQQITTDNNNFQSSSNQFYDYNYQYYDDDDNDEDNFKRLLTLNFNNSKTLKHKIGSNKDVVYKTSSSASLLKGIEWSILLFSFIILSSHFIL